MDVHTVVPTNVMLRVMTDGGESIRLVFPPDTEYVLLNLNQAKDLGTKILRMLELIDVAENDPRFQARVDLPAEKGQT